ncbi:hypothetical protein NOCD_18360 [Nocardioides cavernae]|uniref:hypothetical protein n=1 Tax=Nocardioides TaxID=1839 RepID=UPI000AEB47AD|nr:MULTISPECIES: hypothetical protein [Nocardioides]MCK9825450.1 hypothetical protein [Nocardioides cavernae]
MKRLVVRDLIVLAAAASAALAGAAVVPASSVPDPGALFKWSLSGPDAETAVLSAQFTVDGATYAITRSGVVWHVNAKTPKAWAGERP